jgi:hypothetical protein
MQLTAEELYSISVQHSRSVVNDLRADENIRIFQQFKINK